MQIRITDRAASALAALLTSGCVEAAIGVAKSVTTPVDRIGLQAQIDALDQQIGEPAPDEENMPGPAEIAGLARSREVERMNRESQAIRYARHVPQTGEPLTPIFEDPELAEFGPISQAECEAAARLQRGANAVNFLTALRAIRARYPM